jgi:Na+/melibiose symporter-like transporter
VVVFLYGLSSRKNPLQIIHTDLTFIANIVAVLILLPALISIPNHSSWLTLHSTVASSTQTIREPVNIALLTIGLLLLPLFVYWMSHQKRHHKPILIPNSLWSNKVFTCICLAVFLTWGSFNALQAIMTFFFQDVQHYSPIQTSLYFLPGPIAGVATNAAMALLVHRIRADVLVGGALVLSAVSPLLMAVSQRTWSYWTAPFISGLLSGVGVDALFTVSNLVITRVFPESRQALAGSVFQTVSSHPPSKKTTPS